MRCTLMVFVLLGAGNPVRPSQIPLAMAQADDMPRRRTPQTDPLVASMAPMFGTFRPVAGVKTLDAIVALEDGFLGAREIRREGRRTSELLHWSHPGLPPKLVGRSDGVVIALVASPGDKYAALSIVSPRSPRHDSAISPEDPGILAVVDLATGKISKLSDRSGSAAFDLAAAFAPDHSRVAIENDDITQVHDLASQRLLISTAAALKLSPLRWDAHGIMLYRRHFGRRTSDDGLPYQIANYRWQPDTDEPRLVHEPRLRSPDGRYSLDSSRDGFTIAGPGGTKRLMVSSWQDRTSFRQLHDGRRGRWIGTQHVIVNLDEPMALDLSTGKVHYVSPVGGPQLVEASSRDGRILVATDERDRPRWAERQGGSR